MVVVGGMVLVVVVTSSVVVGGIVLVVVVTSSVVVGGIVLVVVVPQIQSFMGWIHPFPSLVEICMIFSQRSKNRSWSLSRGEARATVACRSKTTTNCMTI